MTGVVAGAVGHEVGIDVFGLKGKLHEMVCVAEEDTPMSDEDTGLWWCPSGAAVWRFLV